MWVCTACGSAWKYYTELTCWNCDCKSRVHDAKAGGGPGWRLLDYEYETELTYGPLLLTAE